ncbi:hypothetical protein MY3957_000744 [Beauveria namnaoensis]
MDEDKPNTSKIHWAIILDTSPENIRLSMESRLNDRTVSDSASRTMLAGFQSRKWIESKSDTSKSVEEFLPFVFPRYTDDSRKLSIEERPIDIGKFL